MLPVWLDRHRIDNELWNTCITNAKQATIYAETWYLDTICKSWGAFVLIQQGGYEAVMPVVFTKKCMFQFIIRPVFCQTLGIFSNTASIYHTIFLRELVRKFKGISHYPLNFFVSRADVVCHYTHHLNLEFGYDSLAKKYAQSRKNKLRKALRYAWTITEEEEIDSLIQIFSENHQHRILNFDTNTYLILKKLFQEARQRNMAEVYVAISPETNQVEAGMLCWKYQDKLIYQFCAATDLGRVQEARTLLIDNLIRRYAGQKYVLDFETTNIPSFMAWNASFGAEKVPFSVLNKNLWLFKFRDFFRGNFRSSSPFTN